LWSYDCQVIIVFLIVFALKTDLFNQIVDIHPSHTQHFLNILIRFTIRKTFVYFYKNTFHFIIGICQIPIFKTELVFNLFNLKTNIILIIRWQWFIILSTYEILFCTLSMFGYHKLRSLTSRSLSEFDIKTDESTQSV